MEAKCLSAKKALQFLISLISKLEVLYQGHELKTRASIGLDINTISLVEALLKLNELKTLGDQ